MDNTIHWLEPIAPLLDNTGPKQCLEIGVGDPILDTPNHERLKALKNEIDKVATVGIWDDVKKITNPYEYIFISLQKRMHRSVAGIAPLSRSYFKMIELWDLLNLSAVFAGQPFPLQTSHTAEGPGGFLEAIQDRTSHRTQMIAMTLRSTEKSVPGWKKSQAFLTEHPDILVSYGADLTGNLYSLANQMCFFNQAQRHIPAGALLNTADGGFDFSADFNGQENTVQRLIAAEALAGLNTLRLGGIMIIKVFDTKCRATLELLWLLGTCFERTGLVKPKTSRPANSERYWIGYNFRRHISQTVFSVLGRMVETPTADHGWKRLLEDTPWTDSWIHAVQRFQEEIEHHQCENIQLTLNIIKSPMKSVIRTLLRENIQHSREWCRAHGITLNSAYEGLTVDQIVDRNLEEVLAPFQVVVGRTHSPALCPREPTHRVSTIVLAPPPPIAPAWRSAIPPSVMGRSPSQTGEGTPPSSVGALPQSARVTDPVPELP